MSSDKSGSQANSDHILIKFEVSIPFAPTSAPVVISGTPAVSGRAVATGLLTAGTLLTPQPPEYHNDVRSTTAGGGVICVIVENDLENSKPPSEIWLKVVHPGAMLTSNPNAHSPTRHIPNNTSPDWSTEVPEVPCGGSANPVLNKLVIWRRFGTGSIHLPAEHLFLGVCAAQTECRKHGIRVQYPLDSAATGVWIAKIAGFCQHPMNHFNGTWTLIEQRGGQWVAGGCGDKDPRITLVDRPGDSHICLELKLRSAELIYKCPRLRWNPRSPNTFSTVICRTLPADVEVPTAIEIRPAQ